MHHRMLHRLTATIAISLILQLNLVFSNTYIKYVSNYQINPKRAISVVSDRFLSFTLEPEVLAHVAECRELNRSINLIRSLLPAYLRIAGPASNKLFFQDQPDNKSITDVNSARGKSKNFVITGPQWLKFIEFVNKTNLNTIVSLNGGLLDQNPNFDVTNALEFINFSNRNNLNVDWELGFEIQKLSTDDGKTMGRDVTKLRSILDVFPRYQNSLVLGPDMTNFENRAAVAFVRNYLNEAQNALNVFTLHPDFSNMKDDDVFERLAATFSKMDNQLWIKDGALKSTSKGVVPRKQIWIAESDHKSQIGQFSDTISLVQRLGAASKLGASVYLRNPHLLSLFEPTTEYWFTVLYKSLVGKTVLDSRQVSGNSTMVYAYSHCTQIQAHPEQGILDPSISYEKGAVTVYGVNLGPEPTRISFRVGPKFEQTVHLYSLTGDNSESVPKTLLNRQLLSLSPDDDLPVVSPRIREFTKNIILPGKSIFFIVLPYAKSLICQTQNVEVPEDKDTIPTTSSDYEDMENKGSVASDLGGILNEDITESNTYVRHLKQSERLSFTTPKIGVDMYPNKKYITYSEDTWLSNLPEQLKDMFNREQLHRQSHSLTDRLEAKNSKLEKYKLLSQAMLGRRELPTVNIANPNQQSQIMLEKEKMQDIQSSAPKVLREARDIGSYDLDKDGLGSDISHEHNQILMDEDAAKINLLPMKSRNELNTEEIDSPYMSSIVNERSVEDFKPLLFELESPKILRTSRGIDEVEIKHLNRSHPVSLFPRKQKKGILVKAEKTGEEAAFSNHRTERHSTKSENFTLENHISGISFETTVPTVIVASIYPSTTVDHTSTDVHDKKSTRPHHKVIGSLTSEPELNLIHEQQASRMRANNPISSMQKSSEQIPFKLEFSTMTPTRFSKSKLVPNQGSKTTDKLTEDLHAKIKQLREQEMARIEEIKNKIKSMTKNSPRNKRDVLAASQNQGHKHLPASLKPKSTELFIEELHTKIKELQKKELNKIQEIKDKIKSMARNSPRNKRDTLATSQNQGYKQLLPNYKSNTNTKLIEDLHSRVKELEERKLGEIHENNEKLQPKTEGIAKNREHFGSIEKSTSDHQHRPHTWVKPTIDHHLKPHTKVKPTTDHKITPHTKVKPTTDHKITPHTKVKPTTDHKITPHIHPLKNLDHTPSKTIKRHQGRSEGRSATSNFPSPSSNISVTSSSNPNHIRLQRDLPNDAYEKAKNVYDDLKFKSKEVYSDFSKSLQMALEPIAEWFHDHFGPLRKELFTYRRKRETNLDLSKDKVKSQHKVHKNFEKHEIYDQGASKIRHVRSLLTNNQFAVVPDNELNATLFPEQMEGSTLHKVNNSSLSFGQVNDTKFEDVIGLVLDPKISLDENDFKISRLGKQGDEKNSTDYGVETQTTTSRTDKGCDTKSFFPSMWCKCKLFLKKFFLI